MAREFKSAGAFKTSLEARLKALAGERKLPLHTVRLKVVIERLLAHVPDSRPPLAAQRRLCSGVTLPATCADDERY